MAKIRFNNDGFDADSIVAWNDDEEVGILKVYVRGVVIPRRLKVDSPQAKALLSYLASNSTDIKGLAPRPTP